MSTRFLKAQNVRVMNLKVWIILGASKGSTCMFPYSLTHYRSREGQDWSTYTVIFWTISFTGCSIGGSFQELRETRGNSSDCWLSYRLRRHTNHHLIRIFVIWVWDMIFWLWLRFRCERVWCCVRIWSPSRSSIFGCFRVINWTSRLLNLLS